MRSRHGCWRWKRWGEHLLISNKTALTAITGNCDDCGSIGWKCAIPRLSKDRAMMEFSRWHLLRDRYRYRIPYPVSHGFWSWMLDVLSYTHTRAAHSQTLDLVWNEFWIMLYELLVYLSIFHMSLDHSYAVEHSCSEVDDVKCAHLTKLIFESTTDH